MKCALKRAFLEFCMLKGILFVQFPILVEFFKLILHTLLSLLDVFRQDPLFYLEVAQETRTLELSSFV
jgi:hypothetical protein